MDRWEEIAEANRQWDAEFDASEGRRAARMALPGFPFYPCPLCQQGVGGCEHKAWERASAAHPSVDPATIR